MTPKDATAFTWWLVITILAVAGATATVLMMFSVNNLLEQMLWVASTGGFCALVGHGFTTVLDIWEKGE
nr:MAG TPA: hypothetical protein [Caudoviricetes sp.]